MFSIDLPGALVKLYTTLRRDSELMSWLTLVLSCVFSAWVAQAGTTGAMLMLGKGWAYSVGAGLSAQAVSVLAVLLRAKQGRTLLLVVPQPIIKQYEESQGGTIIGPAVTTGKK